VVIFHSDDSGHSDDMGTSMRQAGKTNDLDQGWGGNSNKDYCKDKNCSEDARDDKGRGKFDCNKVQEDLQGLDSDAIILRLQKEVCADF
jgi:hypothetical protein